MKHCKFENDCAFTHLESNYKKLDSIKVYEHDFCHGSQQADCIRVQIQTEFGKVHVPSNMMPNGLPLPGTHRRDWTEIALQYKKHLNHDEF